MTEAMSDVRQQAIERGNIRYKEILGELDERFPGFGQLLTAINEKGWSVREAVTVLLLENKWTNGRPPIDLLLEGDAETALRAVRMHGVHGAP